MVYGMSSTTATSTVVGIGAGSNAAMSSSTSTGTTSNVAAFHTMTVGQLRELHARAVSEAEAKRTELKLVVTSRYKELVGSSDEVQTMQQCSRDLFETVCSLVTLLDQVNTSYSQALQVARTQLVPSAEVLKSSLQQQQQQQDVQGRQMTLALTIQEKLLSFVDQPTTLFIPYLRARLEVLNRRIHRALDNQNPHLSALALAESMTWIALYDHCSSCSTTANTTTKLRYPLARKLSLLDPKVFQESFLKLLQQYAPRNSESIIDTASTTDNSPEDNVEWQQRHYLSIQIRLTYLQTQCLPMKTIKMALVALKSPKTDVDEKAGALATLPLLDPSFRLSANDSTTTATAAASKMLDLYFDSKSNLLSSLLDTLEEYHDSNHNDNPNTTSSTTTNHTEDNNALSNLVQQLQTIVIVLQNDLILHPYTIFLEILSLSPHLSAGAGTDSTTDSSKNKHQQVVPGGIVMQFDPKMVKAKCSRFLAAHLPMIANRLRTVLSSVNTATHLATIRQVLYQQTNTEVDQDRWNKAVQAIVDLRVVLHAKNTTTSTNSSDATDMTANVISRSWLTTTPLLTDGSSQQQQQISFSLWSILFSQTFDSLVENLLRQSCMSLHHNLISTLRRSISLAPSPSTRIKPHEAYRNCQNIVCTLDAALAQLTDDAWKLVHTEERHVSSVALRQSLYTQTCEAMARLLCELRLLVRTSSYTTTSESKTEQYQHDEEKEVSAKPSNDGVKEIIVARLCFLLKYRLKSLQSLLDPASAPWYDSMALISTRQHMITYEELQSAFEIADDDDDGILSLQEATDALEVAFSGSNLDGSKIISTLRHDMNLSNAASESNVTLPELTLLISRNIKYESNSLSAASASAQNVSGDRQQGKLSANYALKTVQQCLDSISESCWDAWANIVLDSAGEELRAGGASFWLKWNVSWEEWLRLHDGGSGMASKRQLDQLPSTVSSYLISYVLAISMEFQRVICPRDFIPPVDTLQEAEELGIRSVSGQNVPPTLVALVRQALLRHAVKKIHAVFNSERIKSSSAINDCSDPFLLQTIVDVHFILYCMGRCTTLLQHGESLELLQQLRSIAFDIAVCLSPRMDVDKMRENIDTLLCPSLYSSCALFLSPLLEPDNQRQAHTAPSGVSGLVSPFGDTLQPNLEGGVAGSTLTPLVSSRRFVLLPIQSDRQLGELALQANRTTGQRSALSDTGKISDLTSKAGLASSSFGFFTSMKAGWKK